MLTAITDYYCQTHRHYHTLQHIARMFEDSRLLGMTLTPEQVWAIWLHDLIYVPGADDNEEKSADEALYLMRRYCTESELETLDIEGVHQIILDTRRHEPTVDASKEVIDLDLYGLSKDWETYARAAWLVSLEFSHLSREEGVKQRLEWIETMVARDRIYFTLSNHVGERAIHNLMRERGHLIAGLVPGPRGFTYAPPRKGGVR